jgi:hypothetical protein
MSVSSVEDMVDARTAALHTQARVRATENRKRRAEEKRYEATLGWYEARSVVMHPSSNHSQRNDLLPDRRRSH